MRADEILNDLDTFNKELWTRSEALNSARNEVTNYRIGELVAAKRLMEDTESAAMMEAWTEGHITGKNEARRKLEMASWLSGHRAFQSAIARLDDAYAMETALGTAYENAEIDYKTLCYQIRSQIAMAQLQAAIESRHTMEPEEAPF